MIRLIEMSDKDEAMNISMKFIEESNQYVESLFNKEYVDELFTMHINSKNSVCIADEVNGKLKGFICLTINVPFQSHESFLQEVLFIVEDDSPMSAIRLFNEAKRVASNMKMNIYMGGIGSNPKVYKLYEKLGLKEIERTYLWTPNK